MDVSWGKHSSVTLRPDGKYVEMITYEKDAPAAVAIGRQAVVTVLTHENARKLGAALIKAANSA